MNHAENNRRIIHGSLLAACSFLVLALVGCGDVGNHPSTSSSPSQVEATLIDEPSRTHDFGSVVSRSGRTLVHRYRLNNTTGRDVKIVEVVNRKTCCGTVAISKTLLHPGESADVEVVLIVARGRFDDVVHETAVETDPPGEIVLRTIAHAHPPIRFEEIASSREAVLTSGAEPLAAEFRVITNGTTDDPPIDLDRVELASTIAVRWSGAKETVAAPDGLTVESRRFVAMLDRTGEPGPRAAEIVLRDGQGERARHRVDWDLVPPIVASPKMVVLATGRREYRVMLRSQDSKAFRVEAIECVVPGLRCRVADSAAGTSQSVVVEVEDAKRTSAGHPAIVVRTDHPSLRRVEIPIVVLD
jgi:hypothetical protein